MGMCPHGYGAWPLTSTNSKKTKTSTFMAPDLSHTRPAYVLVLNWERGKHAALDITITSPLIPSILTAASLFERGCSRGGRGQEAQSKRPQVFRAGLDVYPSCGGDLPSPAWPLTWPSPLPPSKVRCSQSCIAG